ncbi:putative surface protease GP63, partial [Trypanosoma theileri]
LVDPRLNVRIAAHEMAHALGFNIPSMKQKGVLTQANIRGKNRMVVSSKMTKEKAQGHYGCPSLPGMELDNDDETDDNGIHPHWTRRVAHDELMAPREEEGVEIYYTALTMPFRTWVAYK